METDQTGIFSGKGIPGCKYGVLESVIGTLADKYGAPIIHFRLQQLSMTAVESEAQALSAGQSTPGN